MGRTDPNSDWPEPMAGAVREAAPEVPPFRADEQVALWERIQLEPDRIPARRRHWKGVVAGLVAVVAVGVGGAATAGVFSAHTGKGPADAEDVVLGGPGERLNPQAPDFAGVLEQETRDVRFPSAQARERALSWEVASNAEPPSQEPTLVSTGALRLWMAGHALCAWTNTWAEALGARDVAEEERAAKVILGARRWPSITDTDPRMANDSEFAWLPQLEQAVRAHDLQGAAQALAPHSACMPGLAPALGLGKRW